MQVGLYEREIIEKLRLAEIQMASIIADVIFTGSNSRLLHCRVSECPPQDYRVTSKMPQAWGGNTLDLSLTIQLKQIEDNATLKHYFLKLPAFCPALVLGNAHLRLYPSQLVAMTGWKFKMHLWHLDTQTLCKVIVPKSHSDHQLLPLNTFTTERQIQ